MNKEQCINYVKRLGGIETKQGWNVPNPVYLGAQNLTEIPIKFNVVQGSFCCYRNQLTSLKNCPKIVKGYFSCTFNQLTSLKYCPKEVQGHFYCYSNQLTSLKYSPKEINRSFFCHKNQLTSLKNCPKIIKGNFYSDKGNCKGNTKEFYTLLLNEKAISKEEYLLRIL